jgi:rhamnose utilization protein RhaD (predicted bifunctional aldolase and dehydrogenase)
MANHGIVVAADGLPEIEQKLEQVLGATRQPVKHAAIPSTAPTMPAILADNYDWAEGADVKALASRSDLFSLSQSHWVMYPDHAIFLGARPLCARREMLAEGNPIADEADVILLQGEGVLVRRQANPAILEQLQCYGDVLARVDLTAPLQALSDSQIGDLLNWDAEKYRQLQAEKNA